HVHHLHAGHRLVHRRGELRGAAVAVGGVVQDTGMGARVGGELGDVLRRYLWIHHQHRRRRGDQGDRREVLQRVVAELLVQVRIHHVAADAGEEKRVAVGRRLRRELRADRAAGAGPVVDDDRLAKLRADLLRDRARHGVVAAAGREGDDQVDRLRRVLSERERRPEKQNRESETHAATYYKGVRAIFRLLL